jgi:hypothetical protein
VSVPQARAAYDALLAGGSAAEDLGWGVSVAFDDDPELADEGVVGPDPWPWDFDVDSPDGEPSDPFTSRPRTLPSFDETLPVGPRERPRLFERVIRTTSVLFLVLTVVIGVAPSTRAGPLGSTSLVACGILGWIFALVLVIRHSRNRRSVSGTVLAIFVESALVLTLWFGALTIPDPDSLLLGFAALTATTGSVWVEVRHARVSRVEARLSRHERDVASAHELLLLAYEWNDVLAARQAPDAPVWWVESVDEEDGVDDRAIATLRRGGNDDVTVRAEVASWTPAQAWVVLDEDGWVTASASEGAPEAWAWLMGYAAEHVRV